MGIGNNRTRRRCELSFSKVFIIFYVYYSRRLNDYKNSITIINYDVIFAKSELEFILYDDDTICSLASHKKRGKYYLYIFIETERIYSILRNIKICPL